MSRKILAGDDEPNILKLLERIISERTPHEITVSGNSLEIPALLESRPFDIIISDLKMPGLDGLDILRLVKERNLPTEVIIITAFGSMDSAVDALNLGVFDYITKPFKKEQILLTIERAVHCLAAREEVRKISDVMEMQPFQKAVALFRREYILRLAAKMESDIDVIARSSGLAPDLISRIIEGEKGSDQG